MVVWGGLLGGSALAAATALAACTNDGASTAPSPGEGPVTTTDLCTGTQSRVSGRIVEIGGAPIPAALIAVEDGNLFSGNPNPTLPNPAYTWGTIADANGYFVFQCPCGSTVGIHAYAPGHKENDPGMPITISADTDVGPIALQTVAPSDQPMLMNLAVDPPSASAGAAVTFSVSAAAPPPMQADGGTTRDFLSDEVLCLEPYTSWGRAMAPPGAPMESSTGLREFPDGTWTRMITAPDAPGTYTYSFVATTVGGSVSNVVTGVLTVK